MRYAKILLRLKNEGELNYSIIPKKLLQELLDEELVNIKTLSASKKKVQTTPAFHSYYATLEQQLKATTRAELAQANSNTKQKKISPQDGLYIAGDVVVNKIDLSLLDNGALFLKEIPNIAEDILIIGVENFENLIYYKQQLYLFRQKRVLFVFRNQKMLEFIANIKNKIIYFGDFDLAGVAIYLNEIKKNAPNTEFFLPKNIEFLIKKNGRRELYIKQIQKYKNLTTDTKIQKLIDIIKDNQKVLEQEFFIQTKDQK
jgi:hypothetical protein